MAQKVKNLSAMQGTRVQSLGWEDSSSWRRAWQPTLVFLAGESHGQRNLVGYSSRDCKESDMTEGLRTHIPTPVFLPGEFHGQRNLVGYSPWGRKELDMTKQLTLSLSNPG